MPGLDLSTFKPQSAGEMAEGVIGQLAHVLGQSWQEASNEVEADLEAYASSSYRIVERLAKGEISQKKADVLLHMQELFLNNIFLNMEFWAYVTAQRALDAATSVVKAAVRNLTGVDLNF